METGNEARRMEPEGTLPHVLLKGVRELRPFLMGVSSSSSSSSSGRGVSPAEGRGLLLPLGGEWDSPGERFSG